MGGGVNPVLSSSSSLFKENTFFNKEIMRLKNTLAPSENAAQDTEELPES